MRLINADKLINRIVFHTDMPSSEKEMFEDEINEEPTVDAAPVKRWKWIIYVISPFDGEDVKCYECGKSGCAPYWDYCPHCGARNDEVINEN